MTRTEISEPRPEPKVEPMPEWNRTAAPILETPVQQLFEAHARRAPDSLAVAWGDRAENRLTYGELERRANQLARHMRKLGVQPESLVAVLLERSPETVISVLATVKAGGAWLPIDPANPAERIAATLRDSGATVLLTKAAQLERLPDPPLPPERVLRLDGDGFQQESTAPPEPFAIDPDHLAYVIYTSGSTGVPKGAALTHRGLANMVSWGLRTFEPSPRDRAPLLAGPGFDASVWEIWAALATGSSLHIPRRETILSPPALLAWLAAERITLAFLATPLAEALLAEIMAAPRPPELALRVLLTGGDRLVRRPWPELAFTLINMYGPTEATVYATGGPVSPAGIRAPDIGSPFDNTRIHLVDGDLRPVAVGETGELYIAGAGLARGYRGRPELTAERFVPNPFGAPDALPGQRMYRTGDLARWLPGGTIEFLGRIDHQVKIRGIRIELGEIETVLADQPEVAAAVVMAREDMTGEGGDSGDRRLVAYVVARAGISGGELRERLARRLTAAMVPAAWVFLDALPLTPNGKLDRRALERIAPPEPTGAPIGPPRTPGEQLLADLFQEVLKLERRLSPHDDFFHLGGHSLSVVQLASRAGAVFGVDVDLRTVFEHPTVAGLAEWIAGAAATAGGRPAAPLAPVARGAESPLSYAQQRLWFLDRLESGGTAVYNIPVAFHLKGPGLRVPALQSALDEIVRRHEALRTVYRESAGGEPVQVVQPFAGVAPLPVLDLSALSDARAAAEPLERELADQPFDLARGPLLRCRLLRLGAEEHRLIVAMHHIASDGWSLDVLARELAALYQAFAQGLPSPLPPLPVQYADFAIWQRRTLSGETLEAQLAWWREGLAGLLPALELPADRPRPARQSFRGDRRHSRVEPETGAALAALGRHHGATLFMTLLAAFYTLLARYTGEEDLVAGTPVAGRGNAETEGLIGFFVNTLVLRTSLAGDPSFLELLARVRTTALEAYAHQDLPFEQLVAELAPRRDLDRSPLFQVLFALWERPPELTLSPGLTGSVAELRTSASMFDLTLQVTRDGDTLSPDAEYAADLFDAATVDRLLGHLGTLLAGAAAAPGRRLSELPLLAAAELEQLRSSWNGAEPEPLSAPTLHELFAAQAARTPGTLAVVRGSEALTYAELEARSALLAERLRRLGAGPEVPVGVCLPRTPEMVVALLAVLRAGGFYLPLDPAYPAERLAYMLEDSGCDLVLTVEAAAAALPQAGVRLLRLDEPLDTDPGDATREPRVLPGVLPNNLAYLIYTSGSTGRPKAVAIEHRGAALLAGWARGVFSPAELAGVLASTSIAFDLSVFEIFVPLAWGGTVILVDNALALPALKAPGALPPGVEVRLLNTVPSAAAELLRVDGLPATVSTLNLAGEALPGTLARAAYRRPETERLYNLYGPSEDTTYSTFALIASTPRRPSTPPIGRPVDGTRAYVLDRRLQPVPAGVPGELHLAGGGLARGYLGRPELTAERFLPDPLAQEAGARMYRTGDLCRRRADGELEYLGRIDRQVKVRGFRIELGEVEAALATQPGVRAAVAVVREDEPGDRRLVAYVVADAQVTPATLRRAVQARLPEAMTPSLFLLLDALPLTANGKVDHRALPIPEAQPGDGHEHIAPRTHLEERIAGLWRALLKVDRLGIHDNFWELGGHSLLATRLAYRVRESFGIELPVRTLFEHPTLAGYAAAIAESLDQERPGEQAEHMTRRTDRGPAPLSHAQQRLWFLDRFQPGLPVYNLPVLFGIAGPLAAGALAAALAEVVRRHEVLRTTYAVDSETGDPRQVVAEPAPWLLPQVDLAGLPAAHREAEAGRLLAAERRLPFDLARGPLLRSFLVRLGPEEHRLALTMHHIVSDGWSIGVLRRELQALYGAALTGRPSPLPELAVQYADFSVWQRRWLAGGEWEAQLAWWRQTLAGAPPTLDLPTDRPRPAVQSLRGDMESLPLGPALATLGGDIALLGRRRGTSPFMTLLAAFEALLFRYTGQDDLWVGTPIANRRHAETENLLGFFVNTLVLRVSLDGDPTFDELLGRVRETALAAYGHQDLPFESLVEELAPARDLSRTPLFQVLFAAETERAAPTELAAGVTLDELAVELDIAKFDLTLSVGSGPEGLEAAVEWATDLFDAATVRRLLAHFRVLLAAAAGNPAMRLSELPLLTAEEREEVLAVGRGTAAPIPTAPVQQLFEAHAHRAPEALAVCWVGGSLTYGELERRANQLAHHLRGLGVRPESLVAILLDRSPETVIAVVATVKAGGAWLPIDPVNPGERIATMLRDSGATALLTTAAHLERLPDLPLPPERVLRLDGEGFRDESTAPPEPFAIDPDHLAFVIYTSGSTGIPKGAALTYRGVANLVAWTLRAFEWGPRDRSSLLAGPGFDATVWEIWPALAAGGSLHVPLRETVLSPTALLAWLAAERITLAFLATPLAEALLEEMSSAPVPAGLAVRALMAGGDRLIRRPRPDHPFLLVNGYGPTETTVFATSGAVSPTGPRAPDIGGPLDNTRIHLVDRHLRPVPVGLPGELYIAGAGLGRGYRGRPELTAERFVPNPLDAAEGPGQRMYRTGDLARWLPGGRIEFLGRIDHQVKIRGIRIELGEIESVIAAQPEVAAAVVMVRVDSTGDRRLVAYVVAPGGIGGGDLRERLARRLPAAMVPAAWIFLEALPLNPNGKLDRRALERIAPPEPEPETAIDGSSAGPRTPTEQILADLFREVLRLDRPLGLHDDFFHFGGHSLLVVRLASRASAVFGVDVDLRTVFEHPTVAGLAEWIANAAAGEGRPVMAPITPAERGAESPLSYAQQRLWFLDRFESGGTSLYNVPVAFHLNGPGLRVSILASALAGIVRRHEALRTVYRESAEGEPVQVVQPFAEVPLPVIDLSALPGARVDAELVERELADQPFDLAQGPVLRCRLLRLGAEEHRLIVSMHHIASDGWSLEVLVREISRLYQAFDQGLPSPLPPLPVQYADVAIWQRRTLAGEILDAQLAWWRERLAGLPAALELPADRPRPARQSLQGDLRQSRLAPRTGAGLAALSRRHGATLFMTLLAAFYTLLSRYTGEEDLAAGTPIAGRNNEETEGLIGFFVNTLVLRTSLAGDPSFLDLLARVRTTALDAYAHQDLPFERLVAELAPRRDLARSPLFQVLFAVQETKPPELSLSPVLKGAMAGLETSSAKFDLTLQVNRDGDALCPEAEYATDLFDAATIDRLLGHLGTLLAGIAASPETRLSRLPLLAAAEREQLTAWNATAEPRPAGATLHGLFEAQAARTPDAVAVLAADGTLTYRELAARSDRLARRLVALGAGIDSRVGLFLERSAEMVVALLGVLKAGASYVPLDPDYPAARLAAMLEDAHTVAVLAQEWLADRLPTGAQALFVDGDWDRELEGGNLPAMVPEDAAAYLIFTSGSTGRPKATTVPHRAIVNHMLWMQAEFPLAPADRVLQKTAFSFDASVWEFWAPLLAGAALVMARPGEHREPAALVRSVQDHGVTVLQTVPTLLRVLLDEEDLGACHSLRRVFCGGEALAADVQTAFFAAFAARDVELINLYGPTETTVEVTFWRCERERASRPALLGGPIANARLHVLGARLEPCPVGVPGELFVGGVPVSRGYLGRAAETASRFLPDPFAATPGERLYRTGDRVRRRPDGLLEYLGRADHQVKVHGVRLELGEVEAALAAQPGVRAAVAVVREDEPGDRRLVAYVVADAEVTPATLRRAAQVRLPEAMTPSLFILLDALPLTPNGKVDHRALSSLELKAGTPEAQPDAGHEHVAPRTHLEEQVAGLWRTLLKVDRLGIHDNFWELGGHSLLATRLAYRVRESFGVELPVRTLFESPTLAEYAAAIAESLDQERPGERAERMTRRTDRGPAPLSHAQQRLWFLDRLQPGLPVYNLPVLFGIAGPLEAGSLAAALTEIVRRHEVLRTTFQVDAQSGDPVQVAAEPAPGLLPSVDLAGLPPALRPAEADRLLAAERRLPFDLERGPLLRSFLVRLGPEDHRLAFTMHHILSDGWSVGVLRRELQALYGAALTGRPSPLPEPSVQYADFSLWQRRWLAGGEWEAQLAWWRQTLAGVPPTLDLPTDRPRPAVRSLRGDSAALPLGAALSAAVASLGRRLGTSPFMTLLAAFEALLFHYTGQEDLWLGTPIANRRHAETENLLGFFVNTLVLRVDLGGEPTFAELLGRVRETALSAYAHQDLPFEKLVEELAPARDLSRTPLFQVLFAADTERVAPTELAAGVTMEALAVDLGTAKFDLTLGVEPGPEGLEAAVEWATDLFDAATVRRLLAHFHVLLTAAAGDPAMRLSELPLLTAEEREEVVAAGRGSAVPIPETPVQQLFEAHARRAPDSLAVAWSDRAEDRLTYGELDRRANGLAHRLRGLGVQPEILVAILLDRSPETVIAVLATVKAGGAWLPIDPANPAERIAAMLRDSGATVLLTTAAQLERLPGLPGVPDLPLPPERVLRLDGEDFPVESPAPPEPFAIDPDHLAYVIYTSGSTGMPKGTELKHRGLANLTGWHRRSYDLGPADRSPLLAGPGFDAAVWEMWPALAAGASLHVPPRETILSPAALLAWLAAERITVAFLPTPLAEALLEEAQAAPPAPPGMALRALLTGGDRLLRRPSPNLPFALLNHSGPTESTVVATAGVVTALDPRAGGAPDIGAAIANTSVHLLDRSQRPVPVGLPGELCIAGAGLARGYRGRPDLTAEQFVPHPPGTPEDPPGERLYRTGDLARWLPGGQIEFLGRIDQQVKIRGVRIELGEIESVLAAQPEVAAAAVLARKEETGDHRLVAYVVAHAAAPESIGVGAVDLRERLARHLPAAMVPAAWVFLDALPLTPNGKVDRRALPAPEPLRTEGEFIAPRTTLEEDVAAIWREVLKVDRVGVDDSFWDLGGHSLIATKVLARVRETFGIDLPLQALFATPRLADFADAVGQRVLATQGADISALLSELNGLSDEELRSFLAAEEIA